MVSQPGPSIQFSDVPKLELDQLIDQLIVSAEGVRRAQGRLRSLLRAIETVTGELSLENVLRNVVDAARDLAGAEYGALGVIGQDGSLAQFIPVGIDEATAIRIGSLPQGKGLLGALITDPRPIRLERMTEDPRSTGFPSEHPPMESFLGVPIHVRDEVFGNLYLANSAKGGFSAEDEDLVVALALAAGTAISNARLYAESRLQQRWLEASVEIGAQMLASSGEDPLNMIARRAIGIADADLVSVSLVSPDRTAIVVEVAFGRNADELIGQRFRLDETLAGDVIDSGEPLLLANAPDQASRPSHLGSVVDTGPLMVLPLRGTGATRGVLSMVRVRGRSAFSATELAMAAAFAAHASVALELADTRSSEQRLVLLEDRDRIAMDLHDHVIQELFSIGLSLEGIAAHLGSNDTLAQRVRQRVDDIDRTIRRIRTSIFELRGNLGPQQQGGLRQRVLEVASELTPTLGFAPNVAFAGAVDIVLGEELTDDVIACVRESLTNVAKHAGATNVMVDVALAGTELALTISDDGTGPGGATRSSGTANLRSRAEKWRGSFKIGPGSAGGTVVTWRAETR